MTGGIFRNLIEVFKYCAFHVLHPEQRIGEEATAIRLFNSIRPFIAKEAEGIGLRISWDPTETEIRSPPQPSGAYSDAIDSIKRRSISLMPFSLSENDSKPHISGQFIFLNSIFESNLLLELWSQSSEPNQPQSLIQGSLWRSTFSLDYIYKTNPKQRQSRNLDLHLAQSTAVGFKEGYNSFLFEISTAQMMKGITRQVFKGPQHDNLNS